MKKRALAEIECFLLDMDGTFYLGENLLPGAKKLLDRLQRRGIEYLFLTNNSSKHRGDYAAKLQSLGVDVPESKIFTSGEATHLYLKRKYAQASIFLVGTPALEEEFERAGLNLVEDDPDVVVLGFDTTFTYDKLWKLCDYVRAGLPYIATHHDFNCPTDDGFMPDIGATIAFVEASTNRRPDVIIGKPHRPMVDALCEKLGLPVDALCMVGDRLYTDIALGQWGMLIVLVLTGEAKEEDLATSEFQPDFVMRDLEELVDKLPPFSP